MLAYKYVVPERVDVIENGSIRFTQSGALNDPFETYPCFHLFKKSLEERSRRTLERSKSRFRAEDIAAGELVIPDKVREHVDKFRRELGDEYPMLSLTQKRNNLLMWSHYASAHRGFVIGFDVDNAFFKRDEKPRTVTPLWSVTYSDKRPMVPALEECGEDIMAMLCLTKSGHWAYEEELRMFAQPKVADVVLQDNDGLTIYLYKFPPECIREIIFGCLMEQSLKDRITNAVRKRYPNAELFQATLNETDFDLDIARTTSKRTNQIFAQTRKQHHNSLRQRIGPCGLVRSAETNSATNGRNAGSVTRKEIGFRRVIGFRQVKHPRIPSKIKRRLFHLTLPVL